MAAKYVPITTSFSSGKAFLSSKSFADLAKAALEDMPNVIFFNKEEKDEKGSYSVKVIKDVGCIIKDQVPNIYLHVLIRSGENAAVLTEYLQKDVTEQILSLTEIPSCKVNVRIEGMI